MGTDSGGWNNARFLHDDIGLVGCPKNVAVTWGHDTEMEEVENHLSSNFYISEFILHFLI